MSKKNAFTLIELLIVVAIIGILAAIAIPNFLLAQTRAKVARVRAEMQTLATGIETYCVDNNHYPYFDDPSLGYPRRYNEISYRLIPLITPVQYVQSIEFHDPFLDQGSDSYDDGTLRYCYNYRNHEVWNGGGSYPFMKVWVLNSIGPDQLPNKGLLSEVWARGLYTKDDYILYDPTNGTVSDGDMPRTGGESRFKVKVR